MQVRQFVQRAAPLVLAGLAAGSSFIGFAAPAQTILIPTNAVWRFLDDGSDQGTNWRTAAFIDSGWSQGPAELGFGDAAEGRPEATTLNSGPAGNVWITHYFRHRFSVTNATAFSNVEARVMRDDGAVVYLNGIEVGRTGMPAGSINYLTLASAPGVSGADEFAFFPLSVNPSWLVEGTNVLAVEVHQNLPSSSDLSFALELVAGTNPPPMQPAGTLIVPTSAANSTAGYGAGTFRQVLRIQEVYGSANFPASGALVITELRYRPDPVFGGPFSATIADIQINLSTTTREPDSLSPIFSQNVGEDDTVVFQGTLSISSAFTGPPGGAKDFDIVVPLQTPFLYDPGSGNLLVDIRNVSGAAASGLLGGQTVSGDQASRVVGNLTAANGGLNTGVDTLQLIHRLTNAPPRPTRLLRGPYLQFGTRTNIMVLWRTSVPTNSVVQFGLSANSLPWEVRSADLTANHFITLTNLAPNTKYFYKVGTYDTNFAGGPSYFFQTAPNTPKPTRIWAIGDSGTTGVYGDGALQVRDAYLAFAGNRYTDVWLMLGDNAYPNAEDHEYQRAVFEVYGSLLRQTPAWSTIGNHETTVSNALGHIAYYDIFRFPTDGQAGGVPSGTLKYYSFDYGNIHFICLDSELSNQTAEGPMAAWLQADLQANNKDWLIAYWHSPPYTKGSHDSDNDLDTAGHLKNMREVFAPILEAHGVDLILSGHSHNYERSLLIDGHYGYSMTFGPTMLKDGGNGRIGQSGPYLKPTRGPGANQGAVYIVAGSSGFATFAVGERHPVMSTQLLQTGSLVLDIDGNRLDAKFLRETGSIDDAFTIIKGGLFIERIQVLNNQVTAWFKTLAGHNYRIEGASSLPAPGWIDLSGPIPGTGAIIMWSGPASVGTMKQFYRAVQID